MDEILEIIEGAERRKYAKKHGIDSLINMYHGLPWIGDNAEKIYRICNEKDITWQDYYGISKKEYKKRIF